MHAIVSLLDDDHYKLIEDLWAELRREFSVQGVYITPYPHFSYQVAQDYDVDLLEDSAELIRQQREERTRELMGESEE